MSSALRTPDALPAIGTISYVRLPVEIGQFTSSRRINQLAAQLDRHADWSLKQGRILAAEKASSRALELRTALAEGRA